jgi:DNA polymerase III epsilon subunit-like protein
MSTPLKPAPQAPSPPAILDIEASGFGLGSYPIEVGFVQPDGQTWCSLVRPQTDWQHWDPNAATVHNITREQLQASGRSPAEIVEVLNDRLRGLVVYSDAWAHDYTWLNRLYEAADRSPSFKLDNLRALLTDAEAARWHEVKREVATSMSLERHRASADARVLQQTLIALWQIEQVAEPHKAVA